MDLSRGGRAAIDRMIEAYGFTTKQALCDQLGISSSTLANRYLRDTFPADFVIQCALETGISLKWLTTGDGNKFDDLKADLLSIAKKKIIDGRIYDASFLMFDKAFIPQDMSSPVLIQDNNNSYFADEEFSEVVDGEWLLEIEGKASIKAIIRIPDNKVRIDYGKLTLDANINDIKFLARITAVLIKRG